ncbi:uncharacterized protein DDB_G0271670-like [Anopheles ziemanni]|uniref:uncharacterized protein DDB_G0271670-like n=1 Tax=Anopheles coustani TaxID=139045 RepID=UPI00265A82E9|nr:uncharacterized protein DDB_G0271670-like [Anopheles coustani]XP_058167907.1 uncharacterized protein DDB_G0271670-like [Anopheles ziemanni]
MKQFQPSSALLFVLIVGLVWSEQLTQEEDTNDLETAESAFFDPKIVLLTGLAGLAGIGALVVKGAVVGAGAGKLLLFAKHAGQSSSHGSSGWDSSSYSSHSSYPAYKSYSSSYSSSSSSEDSRPSSYSGSLKVSGSLSPVSSHTTESTTSTTTAAPNSKASLSLDDVDDPLPEN